MKQSRFSPDHPTGTITISREELYKRVWETPASKLAREFGVSDVALAKVCKKLNVPKPSVGYWQLIKYGHRIKPVPLPPSPPGSPTEHTFVPPEPTDSTVEHILQDPEIRAIEAFEHDPVNKILVPAELRHPSELVSFTRNFAKESHSVDQYGRIGPWYSQKCLDIRVSPESVARALRIFDAFVKACDSRKCKVDIDTNGRPVTYVSVLGERVNIRLIEKVRRTDSGDSGSRAGNRFGDRYEYKALGRLTLEVLNYGIDGSLRKWSDSNDRRLEEQLNDIMVCIAVVAKVLKIEEQRRKEDDRKRQEEENRRMEAEERRREEERRFQELDRQAQLWKKGSDLLEFIRACEASFRKKAGRLRTDSPEARWLRWARDRARMLDPIQTGLLDQLVRDQDAPKRNRQQLPE